MSLSSDDEMERNDFEEDTQDNSQELQSNEKGICLPIYSIIDKQSFLLWYLGHILHYFY